MLSGLSDDEREIQSVNKIYYRDATIESNT